MCWGMTTTRTRKIANSASPVLPCWSGRPAPKTPTTCCSTTATWSRARRWPTTSLSKRARATSTSRRIPCSRRWTSWVMTPATWATTSSTTGWITSARCCKGPSFPTWMPTCSQPMPSSEMERARSTGAATSSPPTCCWSVRWPMTRGSHRPSRSAFWAWPRRRYCSGTSVTCRAR